MHPAPMPRPSTDRPVPQRRRITQPLTASDRAVSWWADGSVWSLAIANAIALGVAILEGWDLDALVIVYWAQSVIIGIANVFRILALDRFSTENFTINDQPVDPTPATKRHVAAFFTVHYGLFHAVYLAFLVHRAGSGLAQLIGLSFWVCVVSFALNHYWSYRYNRDLDRQGTPNIGTLMFTPYARIIPMHVVIGSGAALSPSSWGMLAFVGLKTLADAIMHAVEHAQLKKVRAAPQP